MDSLRLLVMCVLAVLLLGGVGSWAQDLPHDALFDESPPPSAEPSRAPELTRTPELLAPLMRLVGGLLVVLLIMGMALKILRRWTSPIQMEEPPVSLLYEQPMGQRRSICFVRVGEQVLVLGVTSSQISYLTRVEEPAVLEALRTSVAQRASLGQSWHQIRERLGLF